MKPIEEVRSKGYHQGSKWDAMPCIVCGRYVPVQRYFVHLVGGGAAIIKPTEHWENGASDLGLYPIGPDCKRRRPDLAEYIIDVRPT